MNDAKTESFPLADMTMEFLRKGQGNTLKFCPQAPKGIRAALDALFSSGANARPALEELIRLVCVLQDERGSPAAAAIISSVLASDPRAIRALGGSSESDAQYIKSRLSKFFGQAQPAAAPRVGARAPQGAFKVTTLNPGAHLAPRRNAVKPARKPKPRAGATKKRATIAPDGTVRRS